jgi:hypothetical protein
MVLEKYAPVVTNALVTIGIVIVSIAVIAFCWYYFFVVRRRKKWFLDIYEQKSDGKLHLVGKDLLEERRYDNGKRVMYWLKRYRAEATPPPIDATDRLSGKDFVPYLKIRQNFVPIQKEFVKGDYSHDSGAPEKLSLVKGALSAIRALRKKYKNPDEVNQRFVYVPISKVPHVDVKYMQMDFDIDMMRINQIDNCDAFFSSKKNFWDKYKELIIIMLGVVMVIIVAYLSFEYGKAVIAEGTSASHENTAEIEKTNSAIWAVASALGADVPRGGNVSGAGPPT